MEHLMGYLVPVLMSLIYLSLGIFINSQNARYLLAGYNTMSEADRSKFDLDSYLYFFKKFFKGLAVSLLLIWILLDIFIGLGAGIVVWILVQIPAYSYFIFRSVRF
ncbi:MAG: hypothetical protein CL718_05025 [Chloroflexi bacterium]|nr:hypothetical protein [Chloroflexota bacterium]|tara:strand:- start:79 stop:396 length:318 start_codon:yes stop_codon:yes gene_type:complete